MEWIQVLVIIGANAGIMIPLWLWIRTEANADRRDLAKLIYETQSEMRQEMKDFHGRLCAIEERNRGK